MHSYSIDLFLFMSFSISFAKRLEAPGFTCSQLKLEVAKHLCYKNANDELLEAEFWSIANRDGKIEWFFWKALCTGPHKIEENQWVI